jgi:hypothetical protein
MGGLVCRAALPFLWDRDNTRPLRPNVIFESFITISTPSSIANSSVVFSLHVASKAPLILALDGQEAKAQDQGFGAQLHMLFWVFQSAPLLSETEFWF